MFVHEANELWQSSAPLAHSSISTKKNKKEKKKKRKKKKKKKKKKGKVLLTVLSAFSVLYLFTYSKALKWELDTNCLRARPVILLLLCMKSAIFHKTEGI